VMTGYDPMTHAPEAGHGRRPSYAFLQKPYAAKDLVTAVRDCLDKEPEPVRDEPRG